MAGGRARPGQVMADAIADNPLSLKFWDMAQGQITTNYQSAVGTGSGATTDSMEEKPFWDAVRQTFGTSDGDVQAKLLLQVMHQKPSEEPGRATLGALHGIGPADTIEGMVAAQMLRMHDGAMQFIDHARNPKIPAADAAVYANIAAKYTRSFVDLIDLLDRRRGKGRNQVNVENVHLHQTPPKFASGAVYHAAALETANREGGKANGKCDSAA